MKRKSILVVLLLVASALSHAQNYTAKLWEPVDIEFNGTTGGNPFDVVATAIFTHSSAPTISTEMFYNGTGSTWTLRFTGTAIGTWSFTTSCAAVAGLDGHSGTVTVTEAEAGATGFMIKVDEQGGRRWGRQGLSAAIVPQYVMADQPNYYYYDASKADHDIEVFIGDHGFNGFNFPVKFRWFDIDNAQCVDEYGNPITNPNPDPRTFEALEDLIQKAHKAGAMVHMWCWGKGWDKGWPNQLNEGANGVVERRLQRYIAARLGPLPGWSMEYSYDNQLWTDAATVNEWRQNLQGYLGWPHFLGTRCPGITQELDAVVNMDYSSYEQHSPTYATYVEGIEQEDPYDPDLFDKPSFFEDRFRVRDAGNDKDYTVEQTRRGLYHSTMAGGAANIWGYLIGAITPERDGSTPEGSLEYPEDAKNWIKTYSRVFKNRFSKDMVRANELISGTDDPAGGVALRTPDNARFIFYKEDTSDLLMDLSAMPEALPAVAIDTKQAYEEIPLGDLEPGLNAIVFENDPPLDSDWIVIVGNDELVTVEVDLELANLESGLLPVERESGNDTTTVVTIGNRTCRRNADYASDSFMYFNIVGSAAFEEEDGVTAEITIEYFDPLYADDPLAGGDLHLQYDGINDHPYNIVPASEYAPMEGTGQWRTHTWTITDAYFGNRMITGADISIGNYYSQTGHFYIDKVTVTITPTIAVTSPVARDELTTSGTLEIAWTARNITEDEDVMTILRGSGHSYRKVLDAAVPVTSSPLSHAISTIDPLPPPGQYYVRVRTADVIGDSGVFVIDQRYPQAVIATNPSPAAGSAPLEVDFDGSGSSDPDGIIVSYSWSFGDGGSATGVAASHTYTEPGTYVEPLSHSASLTVTDDDGLTTTVTIPVDVYYPGPFTLYPAVVPSVADWIQESNILGEYDGDKAEGEPTGTTYLVAEEFEDWVLPPDKSVTRVEYGLLARFTDGVGGKARMREFSQGEAERWLTLGLNWKWRDYDITALESSWTKAEVDALRVGVRRAYDDIPDVNLRVGAIRLIISTNQAPVAVLSASPTQGDAPLTVTFNATGSYDPDGTPITYQWDFEDDGTIDASGATATHTYSVAAGYTARLIVTDDQQWTDEETVEISVTQAGPVTYILYPTTVPNVANWTQESYIIGPYDGNKAEGSPTGTTYLKATDFDSWVLPAGKSITKVEYGVLARFTDGVTGKARMREFSHSEPERWLTFGGAWSWLDFDVTALEASWTKAEVDALQVGIRRAYATDPDANLRVGGIRVKVTVE
jgi:PKD repeat protein